MTLTNNRTQLYILNTIQRSETCELYKYRIDVETGARKIPEDVDKQWLLDAIQEELDARFLNTDTTVELYCSKQPGDETPDQQVLDPEDTQNNEITINEQAQSIASKYPSWLKIGIAGIIIYLIIK